MSLMMFTSKASVLARAVRSHVPEDNEDFEDEDTPTKVSMYIQDCTTLLDFYFLYQCCNGTQVFALVDSLPNRYILDLLWVDLESLDGHTLFYKIYKVKERPCLDEIHKELFSMKLGNH